MMQAGILNSETKRSAESGAALHLPSVEIILQDVSLLLLATVMRACTASLQFLQLRSCETIL